MTSSRVFVRGLYCKLVLIPRPMWMTSSGSRLLEWMRSILDAIDLSLAVERPTHTLTSHISTWWVVMLLSRRSGSSRLTFSKQNVGPGWRGQ